MFLQLLLGYPSLQAGLVMSPRGIGAIVGSIVAGRILSKVDGRLWMAQGVVVLGLGMFLLGGINLNISPGNILWPIIITGFGTTSIFVPMSTFSVATMKPENMGDAAGLTSLVRNLGGSVGISLVTALVTRSTQAHQDLLVGHLTQFAAPFRNQLATLQHSLAAQSGHAAQIGLRRFEPHSSTAGGPIGLHGQFPPPGTDLSRVSAYHLPVQESQGTGAGRHASALKQQNHENLFLH